MTDLGIDFQTGTEADIEAYADDSEHAVKWTLRRVGDCVEVRTFYYEAGLCDEIGGADVIETDLSVSEYARQELLPDAEEELQEARDYWSQPAEEREAESR